MYNRNYGGFDFVRIHSQLLMPLISRKNINFNPVTDGYTYRCDSLTKNGENKLKGKPIKVTRLSLGKDNQSG